LKEGCRDHDQHQTKHTPSIPEEYCVNVRLISNLVDAVNATQAANPPHTHGTTPPHRGGDPHR
jgi:hypothetical protein